MAIIRPRGLTSRCTICSASQPPSSSFGIASAIIFFRHLECYHLLLALQAPSSSFGLANAITVYFFIGFTVAPLWAVISTILPHRCAPLDDIIFYLAYLGILSSIFPHGCTPLAILFSIQPDSHTILSKHFTVWPHGCTSPGKIPFLQPIRAFCEQLICKLPWR
jgi:hypothetical protein